MINTGNRLSSIAEARSPRGPGNGLPPGATRAFENFGGRPGEAFRSLNSTPEDGITRADLRQRLAENPAGQETTLTPFGVGIAGRLEENYDQVAGLDGNGADVSSKIWCSWPDRARVSTRGSWRTRISATPAWRPPRTACASSRTA